MRIGPWIVVLTLFVLSAAAHAQQVDIASATWRLVGIGEGGSPSQAVGGADVTMAVVGGEVSGSASCNRYFGTVAVGEHGALRFGPIASTMMACADLVMDQERRFLRALESARFYLIGPGGELRLFGSERLVFERMDP